MNDVNFTLLQIVNMKNINIADDNLKQLVSLQLMSALI